MSKQVEGLILAEAILNHFEEEKQGIASGNAWYELVDMAHSYVLGFFAKMAFVEHLEFTFGFEDEKEFDEVAKEAQKYYKEMAQILYGA